MTGCNVKFWFDCETCFHEFDVSPNKIFYSNRWCPYCANCKLCSNPHCQICHDKSFASHKNAIYLTEENALKAREMFKFSGISCFFKCNLCNHNFPSTPASVSSGRWCPYCCIPTQKLCENITCKHCHGRSFASHPNSKFWSTRNIILPRNITLNCSEKYWFYCPDCKHDFDASPNKVNINRWCPYCAIPTQKICNDINCVHCYYRTCISHLKMAECWSKQNTLTAREVCLADHDDYWFDCDKCKLPFQSNPHNITNKQRLNWCPNCVNKTEAKLFKWFLDNIRYEVIQQKTYEWCKSPTTGRYYFFDFVIEALKIIFELDGRQHFDQVRNWESPEIIRARDVYKAKYAHYNGYTVIRIFQEDVWLDRNDWQRKLMELIKPYFYPQLFFISSGNHYQKHITDIYSQIAPKIRILENTDTEVIVKDMVTLKITE